MGLGAPYHHDLGMNGFENIRKPVYYKKGSETWGSPLSCDLLLQVGLTDNQLYQYVHIYPNPTSGMINITVPDGFQLPGRLEVFDLTGGNVTLIPVTYS